MDYFLYDVRYFTLDCYCLLVANWLDFCCLYLLLDDTIYYLFHLDYFWCSSVDFQDVIDADYVHDFFVYHIYHTLVYVQNYSCLFFGFSNLLEKGFEEDSQVEFNFSWFWWWVFIDVLDFHNLWLNLDDLDKSFEGSTLDGIEKVLFEV